MGCQSNQPLLAGGLTPGIKQKSHIWLSHITYVVIVKQQDGDKKTIAKAVALPSFSLWRLLVICCCN
jgi:hypothetical protein